MVTESTNNLGTGVGNRPDRDGDKAIIASRSPSILDIANDDSFRAFVLRAMSDSYAVSVPEPWLCRRRYLHANHDQGCFALSFVNEYIPCSGRRAAMFLADTNDPHFPDIPGSPHESLTFCCPLFAVSNPVSRICRGLADDCSGRDLWSQGRDGFDL